MATVCKGFSGFPWIEKSPLMQAGRYILYIQLKECYLTEVADGEFRSVARQMVKRALKSRDRIFDHDVFSLSDAEFDFATCSPPSPLKYPMSSLFSWLPHFRKAKDDDYETVLSALAMDIDKRRTKLADIRLREQRAKLAVTLYTLSAWVLYVGLWYTNVTLPGMGMRNAGLERFFRSLPTVIGPIIILFIRRIVQIWYTRKGDAEEKTLQKLMKEQRAKVDEIKKKTNYYITRELLQRYDESSPNGSPARPSKGMQPTTPQRMQPNSSATGTPNTIGANNSPQPPAPTNAGQKQWYDKLAETILGDQDDTARYALICEECFAHNGLVKEAAWEDIQYVCPKCQHFNPSRRSNANGKGPRNVSASPSPSSKPKPRAPVVPPSPSRSLDPTRNTPSAKSPLREATNHLDGEEDMEVDDES